MSYQVLARKWRPQTFQQVIGQPHVLTALENGLNQDRVHHAYLFSGTRGVGKTTIARIFAKSLNCELGVTATPCGTCANCVAIDQGRFVDLLEIDAASRTKVDDTRELLDNVQYKPAQGRYKVYLIDEVHMLSKHSFNALLKTLEEPPEYVKFLLATTDPQKLPITVLSRCLQFHLKAILPEQIEHQLATILAHEQARYEQGALSVIAKAADGSMRDALSLTDQALAFGAGNIKYAAVLKMLGTIDQSHLHYLLHFIASGNSQKVFEKIQEFVHLGADFSALHQELASLCHQIALMQLQLNANVTEKTAVQLLAERLTPEEVQLFYQIALQGYKDYAFAPNGKVALEMTVMRLLAFKPANYVDIDEAMLMRAQQVEAVVPSTENTSLMPPTKVTEISLPEQPVNLSPESEGYSQLVPTELRQSEMPVVEDPASISPTSPPQQQPDATMHLEEHSNSDDYIDIQSSDHHGVVINEYEHSTHHHFLPDSDTEQEISSQPDLTQQNAMQPTTTLTTNIPENTASTSAVKNVNESEPVQVIKAPLVTSNSRNMLRSHRLKREELKKTNAVVDPVTERNNQSAAVVTANNTISNASSNSISSPPIVEQLVPEAKPQIRTVEPIANGDFKANNAQELPPLSSYQDHSSHQNVNDFDDLDINEQLLPTSSYEQASNSHSPERLNQEPSQQKKSPQSSVVEDPTLNNQIDNKAALNTLIDAPVVENNDISALHQGGHSSTEVMLIDNGSFERLEIDVASYVDDKMTDSWFLAIKEMGLVGFEKLLAKSTVMQQKGQKITLTLHEPQQHLLNNQQLCEDLKMKLRHYYGQDNTVSIEAGKVPDSHTPMELELIVYQQYLDDAKSSIKDDPIVKTFVQDYAAKVYENSVVPL